MNIRKQNGQVIISNQKDRVVMHPDVFKRYKNCIVDMDLVEWCEKFGRHYTAGRSFKVELYNALVFARQLTTI
jgi:hypothetical protein